MKQKLRKVIKGKNEYFYLITLIERFLTKIRHEYRTWKIDELEDVLVKNIENDQDNRFKKHHLEFVKIVKEILGAFELAFEAHKEQKRVDGENYIIHPIQVALNEIYHQEHEDFKFNEDTIVSALLHDTVEDTYISIDDIYKKFSPRIAEIVKNVTDNPEWSNWYKNGDISKLEEAALQFVNANKLKESMSVKFDDRRNNLETLDKMPEKKAVQKIMDTISVGYIEQASYQKEYAFLEVLRDSIYKYLNRNSLHKYYGDDKVIIDYVKQSIDKVNQILKDKK